MAPHSSTLAWKIPWTEEPGRLQSMGSLRVRHDWATLLSLFTFMHWRRQWQPTPDLLPGESQGWEPGGLPSMGSHRVRHDWSDLVAVAATYWLILPRLFLLETCKGIKIPNLRGLIRILSWKEKKYRCGCSLLRKPWIMIIGIRRLGISSYSRSNQTAL